MITGSTRHFLALLYVATPLLFAAPDETKTFFEIPIKQGVAPEPSKLDGFFPSEVLHLRNDWKPEELFKSIPGINLRKPGDYMGGTTPESCYLEHIEISYEAGRLRNFTLCSQRIPPSKSHFISWILEIERLIGPPARAFREFEYGKFNDRSLTLLWSHPPNALMLQLNQNKPTIVIRLTYYPGPENPGLKRVMAMERQPVEFKSLRILLDDYTNHLGFFPEGMEATPALKLPEGEQNLLAAYFNNSTLARLQLSRDDITLKKPLLAKIEDALDRHYETMGKTEKYERLTQIAEGKVPGLALGEVQVGAAHFLARHPDTDVLPYLLRGIKVECPAGVAFGCEAGIAKQCDEALVDRLFDMFEKGELPKSSLGGILLKLPTKRHCNILKEKRGSVSTKGRELMDAALAALKRYDLPD